MAITGVEGGNDTINAAEATGGIELLRHRRGRLDGRRERRQRHRCSQRRLDGDARRTRSGRRLPGQRAVDRRRQQHRRADSRTLTVDRVTQVAITGVEGGNDTINAAEATGGIELSGTAEAGSTVVVNGVNATVAANGAWTVTLRRTRSGRRLPLGSTCCRPTPPATPRPTRGR